MFAICVEVGCCGFGYTTGLIPELRMGVVRLMWCRGSLFERLQGWRQALRDAASELRLMRGDAP